MSEKVPITESQGPSTVDISALESHGGYGTIKASRYMPSHSSREGSRWLSRLGKVALASLILYTVVDQATLSIRYGEDEPHSPPPPDLGDHEQDKSGQCSYEYPDCFDTPVVRVQCNTTSHPDCIIRDGRTEFFLDWLTEHERGGNWYCESVDGEVCVKRYCHWWHDGPPTLESIVTFPKLNETEGSVEIVHPANSEFPDFVGSGRVRCTRSGELERVKNQERMYLMGRDLENRLQRHPVDPHSLDLQTDDGSVGGT